MLSSRFLCCNNFVRLMTDAESGAAVATQDAPLPTPITQHSAPPTYYNGGPPMLSPMNSPISASTPQQCSSLRRRTIFARHEQVRQRMVEKFFPGAKRAAEQGPPVPPFMPAPPGMPGIPPPPFIIPPAPHAAAAIPKDAKRIKFNDEDSDENELFAKLLYKKLKSIASRKRLEILHVSIMEMVRQAQEEDERERGVRVRALGFNAIQYYIPWNFHEIYEGKYNFSGMRNFTEFSRIAYELGMYSLVRVGPYVCGEWENGGLPWWLLNKNITDMRTSESGFKKAVDKWYSVLLPLIKPLMRHNGGPVLMLQVENEYGSYKACDRDYTKWLRDRIWYYVGKESVLYTTDGNYLADLKCGSVPYTLTTVDFGPTSNENINNSFILQ
ncbi:glycosyl hydrolase family 35, partial [Cooperia oncophora]